MTLQCVVVFISADNITIVQPTVWSRDGMPVQVTNANGTFLIPNHNLMFNPTTGGLTDLVITNVTLDDDNTLYTCTVTGSTVTSSVVLSVTGTYYKYHIEDNFARFLFLLRMNLHSTECDR